MTYQKSSAGLQLEPANFGDGVIRVTGSNRGQYDVNYFMTDHLGSVRVIVDGSGVVKERNDYYPFGARHVMGDYPKSDNRLKYNSKEDQVTGDLGWLDYGARMYDSGLGRWFGMDPLAEEYLNQSPYHFCGNNSIIFVDPNGMDYWTTNDPGQIAQFLNAFKHDNGHLSESFDYGGWSHATDQEFLEDLTFNDKTRKFYFSYSETGIDPISGNEEVYRIGRSLEAFNVLGMVAHVSTAKFNWYQRSSGAIQQDYHVWVLL